MSLIYTSPTGSGLVPGQLTISRYRTTERGAVATVTVPGGLNIHGIWIKMRNGRHCVNMPFRTYPKQTGGTGYESILEFSTPEGHAEFERHVLAALERYLGTAASATGPRQQVLDIGPDLAVKRGIARDVHVDQAQFPAIEPLVFGDKEIAEAFDDWAEQARMASCRIGNYL